MQRRQVVEYYRIELIRGVSQAGQAAHPNAIGDEKMIEGTVETQSASRIRWMSAVANAASSRRMVPVVWDTGTEVSRREPYGASAELLQLLRMLALSRRRD